MSLFCQIDDCSSLSPAAGVVPVPRRTSARSRNATELELFVKVTVVARSAPFGPACVAVVAVTAIEDDGIVASDRRPVRLAYVEIEPTGWPSALLQLVRSCVV